MWAGITQILEHRLRLHRLFLLVFLFLYIPIPIYYGIKFCPPFVIKFTILIYLFTGSFVYILSRRVKKREIYLTIKKEEQFENINVLSEKIHKDSQIIWALENKIQRYTILKSFSEELIRSFSLENTVKIILDKVYSLIGYSKGAAVLYLLDFEKQKLKKIISLGEEIEFAQNEPDIFDNWVFKHQVPLIIIDTKKDFRFDSKESLRFKWPVGSLISTPLIVGKKIIGILRLNSKEKESYSADDLRFLSVVSDLAALSIDNSLLYQHTQQLAMTDGLTGLYLRQYFMLSFNNQINQAMRDGYQLSVLMLDIDRFKKYNDKFGHISGDIVLKRIADLLKQNCPKEKSILTRYGGEEFVILLSNTDKKQAKKVAEVLRKKIELKKIILRRIESSVTVSIGLATYPQDGALAEELLRKADLYLYKAKHTGRNKLCFC